MAGESLRYHIQIVDAVSTEFGSGVLPPNNSITELFPIQP